LTLKEHQLESNPSSAAALNDQLPQPEEFYMEQEHPNYGQSDELVNMQMNHLAHYQQQMQF
jgi:hypothetical protein